jgi:hypothetical protein
MGNPKEAEPAKLFMSLMLSEDGIFGQATEDLRLSYGEIDFMSERFPFLFTHYYEKEMGSPLFRHFISFKDLISVPLLPDIKRKTNLLEEKYGGSNGNRRINIDPGYLCLQHVLLATTKGYTHRPYLREGIYADLTLIFRERSFHALEWTYPDYRQPIVIELFNRLRESYREDLKRRKEVSCLNQ